MRNLAFAAVAGALAASTMLASPAEASPRDNGFDNGNRCTATFNNLVGLADGQVEIVITRSNSRDVLLTERLPGASSDAFVELAKRATHVDGVERFFDRALGWIPLIGALFQETPGYTVTKHGSETRDVLCAQAAQQQIVEARAIIDQFRTSNIITNAARTLRENCVAADDCDTPAATAPVRRSDIEVTQLPPIQYENVLTSPQRVIQIGIPCDCVYGERIARKLLLQLAEQYEGQARVVFYENKQLSQKDADGNMYSRYAFSVVDIYPDGRVVNLTQPAIFTSVNGELTKGLPMTPANLARGATGLVTGGNIDAFAYLSQAMNQPKPQVTVRRAVRAPGG